MSTAASAASTRSRSAAPVTPKLAGPNATSSPTVGMNSWSSGSWKTIPTRRRISRRFAGRHRQPADRDAAGAGPQDAVEVQHQRRLARPVRAEQRDPLAGLDAQVDPVQGLVPVGVGEREPGDLQRRRPAAARGPAAEARTRSTVRSPRAERSRQRSTPAAPQPMAASTAATPAGARPATHCRRLGAPSAARGQGAVEPAGEHREVHPLAALVGADEQRAHALARSPRPATGTAGRARGTGGPAASGRPRRRSGRRSAASAWRWSPPAPGRAAAASPSSRSRSGVVAARVSEISTPSVPLTTMFQAPSRPGSDSANPSTSIRGPGPVNGSSTASTTNGSSITARRRIQPGGIRASAHTTASTSRCPANTPNASRGVATTQTAPSSAATIFTSAGSRCTGRGARQVQRVGVARAHRRSALAGRGTRTGRRPADRRCGAAAGTAAPRRSAVTSTPMIPASPVVPSRPPTA